MACTNLSACDGTVSSPSIAFQSNTKLGFYRLGTDQMGLSVGANGLGVKFGNFTTTNIVPSPYGPNTVRYTSSIFTQPLGGSVESTGLYMKMDHSAAQMVYGIYGEIDASQSHTGGSFSRVTHLGAGDAHYVGHFGANGLGYESASWADGTTGFLADVQIPGLSNSIMFNALWEQPTIPNYGMFVATAVPANALTISKYDTTHEGNVQIRITEPNYGYDRFEVFNSGQVNQIALHSTSTATLTNAPEHRLVASYWNGSASVEQHAVIGHAMDSAGSSHMYVKVGPYASEQTVFLLSPGQVDLQTSQIVTCGGLSMKAGGANVDMQTGSVLTCGGLSMKAGGANIDMQTGSVVTCGGLSMKAGGANVDMQGGVIVNCNSVQSASGMTVAASGTVVAQFSYDSVDATGAVALNVVSTNVASAGTADLPANPLGFMVINLNGTNVKVPYYAA